LQCGCAFHRGCFDHGLVQWDFVTPRFRCRFCRDAGRSDDYFAPMVYL
jgi:hypothetical protein